MSVAAVACATTYPGGCQLPRPHAVQVKAKLPWFLEAVPSAGCAKGGVGAYSNSLQRDPQDLSGVAGLHQGVVAASSFRTQYVPLSKQQDFIDALQVSIFCGSKPWACLQTSTTASQQGA